MKSPLKFLPLLFVFALVLAACAPGPTPANTAAPSQPASPTNPSPTDPDGSSGGGSAGGKLKDTAWILETLNGQPVLTGSEVTLQLDGANLSGADGCNSYSGSYQETGSQFKVNPNLVSTMMACADPIMTQASAYTAMLTLATNFQLDGQQLQLLDASGKALAVFGAQSSQLGGTAWVVTGYNNGSQAVVSVLNGTELTADFGADGSLSGKAGCNNYSAQYTVTGKTLNIGPAAATRMFCAEPAGVMEQEAQFLQALQTAASFSLNGSQLELRTADGALAVSFVNLAAYSPVIVESSSLLPALGNAEYLVENTTTGKAQLVDGVFEEPAAPGSAAKITVKLAPERAFGDLNGDGAEDAAVILVVDPGGSGTFSYLAVVLNQNGAAKAVPSLYLGDRIAVQSVTVEAGKVVVTLMNRKADEPMSAAPTVLETHTFALQGETLVEAR